MNSTIINSTKRLSGLQGDVLILYRGLLRAALKKDSNKSGGLYSFVRKEFRDRALSIKRNDFKIIEFSLRDGYKKKKLLEMPGFSAAQGFKV